MMSEDLVYCTDCYFMFLIYEDEMDCANANATPENGAPEVICSEPHNCPYYEENINR